MADVAAREIALSLQNRVEVLFVGNVDAVLNVACRVLWNRADAEDVVQATFVKAFTRMDQLRDSGRSRPWLLQVAYRESIAVVRRRRELPMDPLDLPDVAAEVTGPADLVVAASVADQVSAALAMLEPDERMAVVLRDVEQLAMREVAEVLGVGLSAAKMRVHRGRQSLRRLLQDEGVR